jgi:hypothetical protein
VSFVPFVVALFCFLAGAGIMKKGAPERAGLPS